MLIGITSASIGPIYYPFTLYFTELATKELFYNAMGKNINNDALMISFLI